MTQRYARVELEYIDNCNRAVLHVSLPAENDQDIHLRFRLREGDTMNITSDAKEESVPVGVEVWTESIQGGEQ